MWLSIVTLFATKTIPFPKDTPSVTFGADRFGGEAHRGNMKWETVRLADSLIFANELIKKEDETGEIDEYTLIVESKLGENNSLESGKIQDDREIDSNGSELSWSQDDVENKSFILRENCCGKEWGAVEGERKGGQSTHRRLHSRDRLTADWELERAFEHPLEWLLYLMHQFPDWGRLYLGEQSSSGTSGPTKARDQSGVESFYFHKRILDAEYQFAWLLSIEIDMLWDLRWNVMMGARRWDANLA
jgi:hypothetical protein